MEKEKLYYHCQQGLSIHKIATIEETSKSSVRYWLKKHGLKTSPVPYLDIDKLKKVVAESKSIHEAIVMMGKNPSTSSYSLFKRSVLKYNVDISHFLNRSESAKLNHVKRKQPIEKYFKSNCHRNRATLKKRVIEENLIPYICVKCLNPGEWRNKRLVLILDHRNGKRNDHRPSNLRFLCPNCNSQLKTHCVGYKPKPKLKNQF